LPLIVHPPKNVVEPAVVEVAYGGKPGPRASICNRPPAVAGSKDVKLKLKDVVELFAKATLEVETNKSLPTSKVLLLVQYVSRGPSFNQ